MELNASQKQKLRNEGCVQVPGVVPNVSPYTRTLVFLRLSHADHDALHWECMTDIWREWEGMLAVDTKGELTV